MQEQDTSTINSQKLDRILMLLEGIEGSPGLIKRIDTMEHQLNGKDGIDNRVSLMWKVWLWALPATGAFVTLLGREAVKLIFKI